MKEILKLDQAKKYDYFSLCEFVDKIRINSKVLEHMQETNLQFDNYFKKLAKLDDEFVLYYWISLAYEELKHNHYVENHRLSNFDFTVKNLFFDSMDVSHDRIHNIHKFIMKDIKVDEDKPVGVYRNDEVRISKVGPDYEYIFAYGAKSQDINKFMNDFLKVYNSKNMSVIDSSPFLKSALIHMLFVKIHPYFDGNGRTARILHNIKFTDCLNNIYGMNLRICPVNLSQSININKPSYAKAFNELYFDLEHDNNEIINYWFDFILNMYDEQLFFNQNMIDDMDDVVERIKKVEERMGPEAIKKIDNARIRK